MKEILVVGVGSCGINLSASYLSLLDKEHNLSSSSSENPNELNVHFHDTQKTGSPIARFIFIDQDPLTIDRILAHPQASKLNQDNLISSNESTHNLYTIAFNSSNIDRIKDVLRREFEKCVSCHGVIVNHSSMGGTGSGLTAQMSSTLKDFLLNKGILVNNVILPSLSSRIFNENTALSIYNTVLGMHRMIEDFQLTFCSDNDALMQKASEMDFYEEGKFESLNKYVSKAISGVTSGTRFTGIQPASLRKICVNAVCYPRRHFFSSYYFRESDNTQNDFISLCTSNVQKNIGSSLKFDPIDNVIENYAGLFRGTDFYSSEIEKIRLKSFKKTHCEWFHQGLLGHAYDVERNCNKKEATIITTGNFIGVYAKKLTDAFTACYRRKSFLHWYTGNGMDEMEFVEAENNLNDLHSKYVWDGPDFWTDNEGEDDAPNEENAETS